MTTTTLYRPIGSQELALIEASGWRAFPPPLPEQPMFYPVTSEAYAREIASNWGVNHKVDGLGFVTRFTVRDPFLGVCERKVIGGGVEYWIPPAHLSALNDALDGRIEIIAAYGVLGERSDILA